MTIIPTMGQLFKGSMLVVPYGHFEAASRMPIQLQEELTSALANLSIRLKDFGNTVAFEHGATCATGSSCGIYHAHVHVVPVPGNVTVRSMLGTDVSCAATFGRALTSLRNSDAYIIFRDTYGAVAYRDLGDSPNLFPSQHIRRRLAEHFHLTAPWDWRLYAHQEQWMFEMLAFFGIERAAPRPVNCLQARVL